MDQRSTLLHCHSLKLSIFCKIKTLIDLKVLFMFINKSTLRNALFCAVLYMRESLTRDGSCQKIFYLKLETFNLVDECLDDVLEVVNDVIEATYDDHFEAGYGQVSG